MASWCRYAHTNIIASDWRRLVQFYTDVFGCEFVPPERNQSGAWLEEGTGVKDAALEGRHLRLPGHGNDGPTLEIYSYKVSETKPEARANRQGFGHIAFEVSEVERFVDLALAHGAKKLGAIVKREVTGIGELTFTYIKDPEDNIVELQSWAKI